jgi:hypothetical protein
MNTTILTLDLETDAMRGDLRPRERSPQPIPFPETGVDSKFGGRR